MLYFRVSNSLQLPPRNMLRLQVSKIIFVRARCHESPATNNFHVGQCIFVTTLMEMHFRVGLRQLS